MCAAIKCIKARYKLHWCRLTSRAALRDETSPGGSFFPQLAQGNLDLMALAEQQQEPRVTQDFPPRLSFFLVSLLHCAFRVGKSDI